MSAPQSAAVKAYPDVPVKSDLQNQRAGERTAVRSRDHGVKFDIHQFFGAELIPDNAAQTIPERNRLEPNSGSV